MTDDKELDDTSDARIPMTPLYDGHAEVYDRYVELRGEEWVEKVERETSVYQFALGFVDSKRKYRGFEKDDSNRKN
jgi:hypothetical protein